jgi:superfamily II DNA/RNA helicase
VCSDLVARGVDISHVTHVVSYDAPVDMRKYVHRVGRTARAGRAGDAWSLVEDQEVRFSPTRALTCLLMPLTCQARYFKQMLKNASHMDAVKKLRVKEKDLMPSQEYYEVGAFRFGFRFLKLTETADGASKSEGPVCSDIKSGVIPSNHCYLCLYVHISFAWTLRCLLGP